MCGIAGYWHTHGVASGASRTTMEGALERMRRRGPDDQGVDVFEFSGGQMTLGHRRLSIIDLSANGHQPMTSADGRHTLVFNGEIYNYLELREELINAGQTFRTKSDSEVLIAAWRHWGTECLPRLNGIFAFAVLDHAQQVLTCVRDAFGIKPLFYSATAGRFCFASELAPLIHLRGEGALLNHQRAYDYLVHGDYDSTSETFVRGAWQLPPATLLRVDLARGIASDPVKWWTPSIDQTSSLSFADAADRVREIFLRNVRLQLRSDVPLGAALSGGVDSSAVVCAMRKIEPDAPIHTFSFVARGASVSEEKWIALVNQDVKSTAHLIEVLPHDLASDLDDLIRTQGEPFGGTSIYAQYRVFKLARDHGMTVTLDGQGADEMLGGYIGYPGQRLRSLLEMGDYSRAARFLWGWANWPDHSIARGVKLLVAEAAGPRLYEFLSTAAGRDARPGWLNVGQLKEQGVEPQFPRLYPPPETRGRRVIGELAQSCSHLGLPALLRHGDRNSMRFSVESRVPFLTTELADFMFSLPEPYLISDSGETKTLFRAAMRGLVPDKILDRRDKIGFATPEFDWLYVLKSQIRQWIGDSTGLTFLDRPRILAELDAMFAGSHKFTLQAWRWINFIRWHEVVFKEMR